MRTSPPIRIVLLVLLGVLWPTGEPSAAATLAQTQPTESNLFQVTISTDGDEVRPHHMHSWVVAVERADGSAVEDATFAIDGGLPRIGRALPTAPRVTRNLGGGRYLLEGVRFNLEGRWRLKLTIESGHDRDNVTFEIAVK